MSIKQSWNKNWLLFKHNKTAVAGVIVLLFFLCLAILGPIYVEVMGEREYDPRYGIDMDLEKYSGTGTHANPPSLAHPLGTTKMGRDIFAQFLNGAKMAFLVGIITALCSTLAGTVLGLTSGYYGGSWIDSLIMWIVQIIYCIPFLPLVLILAALFGGLSLWGLILIMVITGWTGTCRIIRAQSLSLRERLFVDAAKVAGGNSSHIMFKHIAPNVLPLAFLNMSLGVAYFILTEASISFLGFGDPTQVSWGIMLNSCWTNGHIFNAPWWMIPPGIGISFLSTGFYLVGRGMEEIINPKLRSL